MLPGKYLPCHKEAASGCMKSGAMPDHLLDNNTNDVVIDAAPLVPKDGQEPPMRQSLKPSDGLQCS